MLASRIKIGKEIIPVYIWNKEEGGAWSPGSAARWWLHQALASLNQDIEDLGGSLILKKGKAEEILPRLAADLQADTLYLWQNLRPSWTSHRADSGNGLYRLSDLPGIIQHQFITRTLGS